MVPIREMTLRGNSIDTPSYQSCPGEVINYLPAGKQAGTHTPGTDVVKMESRTHVYLALDYTDEGKPKLLAIEEVSV
jgi:hypothetical protein